MPARRRHAPDAAAAWQQQQSLVALQAAVAQLPQGSALPLQLLHGLQAVLRCAQSRPRTAAAAGAPAAASLAAQQLRALLHKAGALHATATAALPQGAAQQRAGVAEALLHHYLFLCSEGLLQPQGPAQQRQQHSCGGAPENGPGPGPGASCEGRLVFDDLAAAPLCRVQGGLYAQLISELGWERHALVLVATLPSAEWQADVLCRAMALAPELGVGLAAECWAGWQLGAAGALVALEWRGLGCGGAGGALWRLLRGFAEAVLQAAAVGDAGQLVTADGIALRRRLGCLCLLAHAAVAALQQEAGSSSSTCGSSTQVEQAVAGAVAGAAAARREALERCCAAVEAGLCAWQEGIVAALTAAGPAPAAAAAAAAPEAAGAVRPMGQTITLGCQLVCMLREQLLPAAQAQVQQHMQQQQQAAAVGARVGAPLVAFPVAFQLQLRSNMFAGIVGPALERLGVAGSSVSSSMAGNAEAGAAGDLWQDLDLDLGRGMGPRDAANAAAAQQARAGDVATAQAGQDSAKALPRASAERWRPLQQEQQQGGQQQQPVAPPAQQPRVPPWAQVLTAPAPLAASCDSQHAATRLQQLVRGAVLQQQPSATHTAVLKAQFAPPADEAGAAAVEPGPAQGDMVTTCLSAVAAALLTPGLPSWLCAAADPRVMRVAGCNPWTALRLGVALAELLQVSCRAEAAGGEGFLQVLAGQQQHYQAGSSRRLQQQQQQQDAALAHAPAVRSTLLRMTAQCLACIEAAHEQQVVQELLLRDGTFQYLRQQLSASPRFQDAAGRALVAASNRMIVCEEGGAERVALSKAQEADRLAAAARGLLPFAVLAPAATMRRLVADGTHHPGQQQLVLQLLRAYATAAAACVPAQPQDQALQVLQGDHAGDSCLLAGLAALLRDAQLHLASAADRNAFVALACALAGGGLLPPRVALARFAVPALEGAARSGGGGAMLQAQCGLQLASYLLTQPHSAPASAGAAAARGAGGAPPYDPALELEAAGGARLLLALAALLQRLYTDYEAGQQLHSVHVEAAAELLEAAAGLLLQRCLVPHWPHLPPDAVAQLGALAAAAAAGELGMRLVAVLLPLLEALLSSSAGSSWDNSSKDCDDGDGGGGGGSSSRAVTSKLLPPSTWRPRVLQADAAAASHALQQLLCFGVSGRAQADALQHALLVEVGEREDGDGDGGGDGRQAATAAGSGAAGRSSVARHVAGAMARGAAAMPEQHLRRGLPVALAHVLPTCTAAQAGRLLQQVLPALLRLPALRNGADAGSSGAIARGAGQAEGVLAVSWGCRSSVCALELQAAAGLPRGSLQAVADRCCAHLSRASAARLQLLRAQELQEAAAVVLEPLVAFAAQAAGQGLDLALTQALLLTWVQAAFKGVDDGDCGSAQQLQETVSASAAAAARSSGVLLRPLLEQLPAELQGTLLAVLDGMVAQEGGD